MYLVAPDKLQSNESKPKNCYSIDLIAAASRLLSALVDVQISVRRVIQTECVVELLFCVRVSVFAIGISIAFCVLLSAIIGYYFAIKFQLRTNKPKSFVFEVARVKCNFQNSI